MTESPPPPSPPPDGEHDARRTPRLGDSRAPVTTVAALAIAAVAVLAGFLVLRSITEPGEGSGDVVSDVATTTGTVEPAATSPSTTTTTTTTSTTTSTTVPRASKSDATIVVANASGVGGSATAMTEELEADGYTVAPVANSTGPRLETSVIHYLEDDPGSEGVARLLAEQIPTARTAPMPDPLPLDRELAGTVVVLLGRDAAGRSLAELQGD